jgi:hypothetical protein
VTGRRHGPHGPSLPGPTALPRGPCLAVRRPAAMRPTARRPRIERKVESVMTAEVVTAQPSTRSRELVLLLEQHRISAVPVTDWHAVASAARLGGLLVQQSGGADQQNADGLELLPSALEPSRRTCCVPLVRRSGHQATRPLHSRPSPRWDWRSGVAVKTRSIRPLTWLQSAGWLNSRSISEPGSASAVLRDDHAGRIGCGLAASTTEGHPALTDQSRLSMPVHMADRT